MLQVVKQRDYIEKFCEFVSSFLVTEEVTIDEMLLVEANAKILLDRIRAYGKHKVGRDKDVFSTLVTDNEREGSCWDDFPASSFKEAPKNMKPIYQYLNNKNKYKEYEKDLNETIDKNHKAINEEQMKIFLNNLSEEDKKPFFDNKVAKKCCKKGFDYAKALSEENKKSYDAYNNKYMKQKLDEMEKIIKARDKVEELNRTDKPNRYKLDEETGMIIKVVPQY